MKLRRMEFGGFRTFAQPTQFHFGNAPGLYFLEGGENAVDPELGSNGVGKSSVWSALCWILFGKTADGLKAGVLHSWTATGKGYYGKLWIGRRIVQRSWKPNKLTLDGEVVEQAVLEDALGLNFDMFSMAVVLAQGESMFFDLLPTKQLSLFTSMLKLDKWIMYSSMARVSADELRTDIHTVERTISNIEGRLAGLGIEDLEQKKNTWGNKKKGSAKELRVEVAAAKKSVTLHRGRLKKAKRAARIRKGKLEEATVPIILANSEMTEAYNVEQKIILEAAQLQKQYDTIFASLKRLRKNKTGTCSHCGQDVGKNALKRHAKQLETEAAGLQITITVLAIDADKAERKLLSKKKLLVAAQTAERKLQKSFNFVVADIGKISGHLAAAVTTHTLIKERYAKHRKEKNPFIKLLEQKQAEESKFTRRLDKRTVQVAKYEKQKEDIEYWVKGFKDVRLYLIEEALQQLELETNKALADLGFSSEWRILYSIDKRTKAGGSISGFNVEVVSPHSKDRVPFAAWSGGEKQRLRIAGSMGFIALASARTGLDLGIEVYDEPTQHLSPQGIDSLLETLRSRALETATRIWLVDHHTLDYGDFEGRALVSKYKEGSKLWQS